MTETSAVAHATNEEVPPSGQDPGYWYSLINEDESADFLDLTSRTMQAMRQHGKRMRFRQRSRHCARNRVAA